MKPETSDLLDKTFGGLKDHLADELINAKQQGIAQGWEECREVSKSHVPVAIIELEKLILKSKDLVDTAAAGKALEDYRTSKVIRKLFDENEVKHIMAQSYYHGSYNQRHILADRPVRDAKTWVEVQFSYLKNFEDTYAWVINNDNSINLENDTKSRYITLSSGGIGITTITGSGSFGTGYPQIITIDTKILMLTMLYSSIGWLNKLSIYDIMDRLIMNKNGVVESRHYNMYFPEVVNSKNPKRDTFIHTPPKGIAGNYERRKFIKKILKELNRSNASG